MYACCRNKKPLFFYEVDKLTSEDESKLLDSYDLINYEGRVPFTVIFKDGKAIATHEGFESEESLNKYNEYSDLFTRD